MKLPQYFNNFLTLLKIGEAAGKMLFNGTAVAADKLPILDNAREVAIAADTILVTDGGKSIRFTSALAVTETLPAAAGFPDGFQCILHNDSANAIDVTLSGTVVASGTKIAQKKSALLRMVGGSWRCSGGLS